MSILRDCCYVIPMPYKDPVKRRESQILQTRRYEAKNPEKKAEWQARARKTWRAKPENKLKQACHQAIKYAIRTGKLIKPSECERCHKRGENPIDIQSHHFRGYAWENRFDVQWLCPKCHHEVDSSLGKLETRKPLIQIS